MSGPVVMLVGPDQPSVAFIAPDQIGTLVFNLEVSSLNGASDDQVTVTVEAGPLPLVAGRVVMQQPRTAQ